MLTDVFHFFTTVNFKLTTSLVQLAARSDLIARPQVLLPALAILEFYSFSIVYSI